MICFSYALYINFCIDKFCINRTFYFTGLTDNMRENFHLMKALAVHTCISPESRIDKLMRFNNRLRQESKVLQEFKDWNMTLERNLLEVPGRVLPQERLIFARNIRINSGRGEWSRDMQRAHLFVCKNLKNWVMIGNQRDSHVIEVNNFH